MSLTVSGLLCLKNLMKKVFNLTEFYKIRTTMVSTARDYGESNSSAGLCVVRFCPSPSPLSSFFLRNSFYALHNLLQE